MGRIVITCPECDKVYRDLEELEDLRDNDSICLACNAPIEVSDWDRVLASHDDDGDLDDIDDEEEIEGSFDEDYSPWGDDLGEDDDDDDDDDDDRDDFGAGAGLDGDEESDDLYDDR